MRFVCFGILGTAPMEMGCEVPSVSTSDARSGLGIYADDTIICRGQNFCLKIEETGARIVASQRKGTMEMAWIARGCRMNHFAEGSCAAFECFEGLLCQNDSGRLYGVLF